MMYIGSLEVMTLSEHNKRAHYWARKYWIINNRKEYRKYFAECMRKSMMCNYCLESMSRKEREIYNDKNM